MKFVIAVFLILFSGLNAASQFVENGRKSLMASFCGLLPSDDMRQMNATFSEMFLVYLDTSTKPEPAKRLLGKYIDLNDIDRCTQKWTFKNFAPNTRFIVTLSWVHGVGWQPMDIHTKDFQLKLKCTKENGR